VREGGKSKRDRNVGKGDIRWQQPSSCRIFQ